MVVTKSTAVAPRAELELDFTGLLGSGQVFAAGNDLELQAEMIDANCNKIGEVACAAS